MLGPPHEAGNLGFPVQCIQREKANGASQHARVVLTRFEISFSSDFDMSDKFLAKTFPAYRGIPIHTDTHYI